MQASLCRIGSQCLDEYSSAFGSGKTHHEMLMLAVFRVTRSPNLRCEVDLIDRSRRVDSRKMAFRSRVDRSINRWIENKNEKS